MAPVVVSVRITVSGTLVCGGNGIHRPADILRQYQHTDVADIV